MKAQGLRNHDLAARGTVLAVLLLCLPALAGCGSPEEPRVQRVAYCLGPSSDHFEGEPIIVEFRQESTVVATGSVNVGAAFSAEVPLGGIQIYVDGVRVGAVNEGVDMDEHYHSPAPGEVTYMRSPEGCPDSAPL